MGLNWQKRDPYHLDSLRDKETIVVFTAVRTLKFIGQCPYLSH